MAMYDELAVCILFFLWGLRPLIFIEWLVRNEKATQFDAFLVGFMLVVVVPLLWLGLFGMPPLRYIILPALFFVAAVYIRYSTFSLDKITDKLAMR